MDNVNKKLLVILGPTATGKTKLAVKLARKFNGEIMSADSRQVYRGMDIGTGKDLQDYTLRVKKSIKSKVHKVNAEKIPYHLIDIVSPKTNFNLAKYQKLAYQAIDDILQRGKLPILTGGTGLYLQAVVEGYNLGGAKPDKKLRASLEKKSAAELRKTLKRLDPQFKTQLDNKRYLIRYIEMVKRTKLPLKKLLTASGGKYECLILGIDLPREEINRRIDRRLLERIEREGMIEEVKRLHQEGVNWKRLENFGLEYKFVSQYLQGKLARDEMIEKLAIAIRQFAKRQMAWFRRWERQGRKIEWVRGYEEANLLVREWVK
ncbi:tRNA (adenosine(37)-N6)-dimethylallyltransferase MiaA [Candidatus Falkowbacteria bacterium CG10_big_fil_rev_8_21_14_0_10_43_11]|uniref:tRNA dimethylallyltransferase n=1 Tax=Candidatus Falkowbacteria bacterium CG10_big_fil_rev_8_21_14_0_10_43_11 TaxID=1974568 RepID=A0A2M6WN37_9BACT|nr:MAG: tRNA (adenosine(37)-N6)-dimethylallyltransferase MiaA [Candidatus Falkowbacteria bacterium CG10_big_fil_rev_8_21_14_0_10_43_11]